MLGLALLLALCGCAALHVDIDVYKGPLANEDDVQLEQVASMAIGAKPLLEKIKSGLEGKAYLNEADRENLECLREKTDPTYSEKRTLKQLNKKHLVSKANKLELDFIKDILDLYKNLSALDDSSIMLRLHIEKANKAVSDYLNDRYEKSIQSEADKELKSMEFRQGMRGMSSSSEQLEFFYKKQGFLSVQGNQSGNGGNPSGTANEGSENIYLERLLNQVLLALSRIPKADFPEEISRRAALSSAASFAATLIDFKKLKSWIDLPENKDLVDASLLSLSEKLGECAKTDKKVDLVKNFIRKKPSENSILLYEIGASVLLYENVKKEKLTASMEALTEASNAIDSVSGRGVNSARGEDGIDALVRNYIEKSNKNEDTSDAKSKLLNELVRFSEKVLFYTNRRVLTEDGNDRDGSPPESRHNNRSTVRLNLQDSREKNEKEQITRVLQAVGYAIQNEVDAIRNKDRYREREENQFDVEKAALNETYLVWTPQMVLKNIYSSAQNAFSKSAETVTNVENEVEGLKGTYDELKGQYGKEVKLPNDLCDPNERSVLNGSDGLYWKKKFIQEFESSRLGKKVVWQIVAKDGVDSPFGTEFDRIRAFFNELDGSDSAGQPGEKGKFESNLLASLKSKFQAKLQAVTDDQDLGYKSRLEAGVTYLDGFGLANKAEDVERAREHIRLEIGDAVSRSNRYLAMAETLKAAALSLIVGYEKLSGVKAVEGQYQALLNGMNDVRTCVEKEIETIAVEDVFATLKAKLLANGAPLDKLGWTLNLGGPVDLAHLEGENGDSKKRQATGRDVLDQLIARLRYQYLKEVEEEGAESKTALEFAQALKVAYGQRADRAFVRSPMHYLRSSYAVSELSDNNENPWPNMLSPFWPPKQDKTVGRIFQELDSQSWQTINSVVVKGGGNTNYAVAKDSMGNWYVKRYEADPKTVIESAKRLALFAAGPGMGVDLVSHLDQRKAAQKSLEGEGKNPDNEALVAEKRKELFGDSPENAGVRGQQLKAAREDYAQSLNADAVEADEKLAKLAEGVESQWEGNSYKNALLTRFASIKEVWLNDEEGRPIPSGWGKRKNGEKRKEKKEELDPAKDREVVLYCLKQLRSAQETVYSVSLVEAKDSGGNVLALSVDERKAALKAALQPFATALKQIVEKHDQLLRSQELRLSTISTGLDV